MLLNQYLIVYILTNSNHHKNCLNKLTHFSLNFVFCNILDHLLKLKFSDFPVQYLLLIGLEKFRTWT